MAFKEAKGGGSVAATGSNSLQMGAGDVETVVWAMAFAQLTSLKGQLSSLIIRLKNARKARKALLGTDVVQADAKQNGMKALTRSGAPLVLGAGYSLFCGNVEELGESVKVQFARLADGLEEGEDATDEAIAVLEQLLAVVTDEKFQAILAPALGVVGMALTGALNPKTVTNMDAP